MEDAKDQDRRRKHYEYLSIVRLPQVRLAAKRIASDVKCENRA
jgi:hypothetical protein